MDSVSLVFVFGTLATWVGGFLACLALYRALRWLQESPEGRARTLAQLPGPAFGAILLLSAGAALPIAVPGRGTGFRLPLAWPVLPVAGWLVLAAAAGTLWRLGQAFSEIEPARKRERLLAALLWAAAGVALAYWWRQSGGEAQLLRGAIVLQPIQALVLALAILASVVAMAWTQRSLATRGVLKAAAAHAALIAGSVVFGLPFVWMLITSFKEERDMASPTGLIWVPKVSVTIPYLDPEQPMIEGTYEGHRVEAGIVRRNADGSALAEVIHPSVLRGQTFTAPAPLRFIPRPAAVVTGSFQGEAIEGLVVKDLDDGSRKVSILKPQALKGTVFIAKPGEVEPKRVVGLRGQNYSEALDFLPIETMRGLGYLRNTLEIVLLSVIGTVLSSSIAAYAFARLRFPGKNWLFVLLLSSMMLPAAVTMLPTFMIFRALGWVDTLLPLWAPAFLGSAFNIFMLRQFFSTIPMEFEDAAKIDGCSVWRTFWSVMLPQIKPALAVVAIWTFIASWNNFMGPLVYITSPEKMPIAYGLQLFQTDKGTESGLLMAAATMSMLPVLLLFFFAQRYFIEGVTLSGLGGR